MTMAGRQGRLSDADFSQIVRDARDRHNLSDIVARHTALKRRGPRELVGLCPVHSEKTPSFEVNDAKGTFYCHGCGFGGDAITFLTRVEGMAFRQAIETLSGETFPVIDEAERVQRKVDDELLTRARIGLSRSFWGRAVPAPGTLAETYAGARGITVPLPPTVRFAAIPRYVDLKSGEVGRDYPAVVCALQNAAGHVTGVQAIYLAPDGRSKYVSPRGGKAKLTWGSFMGCALRLGPIADHVVICEGPEDGWTLAQAIAGQSVWVSCGTANLSRMELPGSIRRVTIAGDNNKAGRTAADEAESAYLGRGLTVASIFPDPQFKDFNDECRGVRI